MFCSLEMFHFVERLASYERLNLIGQLLNSIIKYIWGNNAL